MGHGKSTGEQQMDEKSLKTKKNSAAATALLVATFTSGAVGTPVPVAAAVMTAEGQTKESRFYCNIQTLTPVERGHHKELTEWLIASRKEIVETETGYEFQYSPSTVSLAQLADWVAAEGKCCPFFDFHIDLEREGSLLCLRLTGEDGIKPFIRNEFQVAGKR
jgi:hypothetical protein